MLPKFEIIKTCSGYRITKTDGYGMTYLGGEHSKTYFWKSLENAESFLKDWIELEKRILLKEGVS